MKWSFFASKIGNSLKSKAIDWRECQPFCDFVPSAPQSANNGRVVFAFGLEKYCTKNGATDIGRWATMVTTKPWLKLAKVCNENAYNWR